MQQVSIAIIKVIAAGIAKQKSVSITSVVEGTSLHHLMTLQDSDWVGWNEFADWLTAMDSSVHAPVDWFAVGVDGFDPESVPLAASIMRVTFSVKTAYWVAAKWFGPSQFRVITCEFEDLGPQKIRETLSLAPYLKPCPQAFTLFAGTLTGMPKTVFGLERAQVEFTSFDGVKGVYDISLPLKDSLWRHVYHSLRNFLNIKTIFAELARQQTALNAQTIELIEERSELKNMMSHFPDGIMIHRQGSIVYMNEMMMSFLNCESFSVVEGTNCIEMVEPSQREIVRQRIEKFRGNARHVNPSAEVSFLKFGSTDLFEGECKSISILYDGSPAVLIVTRDITERKEYQSHRIATDRLTTLGQLAAGVGHEINNPLGYVMLRLESIRESLQGKIDETTLRHLQEVDEGLQRVQSIVKDLKSLSRNHKAEDVTAVNIEGLLRSSIAIAFNEIKHRAQLVVSIQDVPPVLANGAQLGQVFLNLLINAAQAIPPGHADQNKIEIRCFEKTGMIIIEISDSGCGISEEAKKSLFKPFYTTKAVGEGTGLGLSICKSIVSRYQGTIEYVTAINKGTTFIVTFAAAQSSMPTGTSSIKKSFKESSQGGHILVIDDDEFLLEALSDTISALHKVTALQNAQDALKLIQGGHHFDVILCDLMMPNMDGIEFYTLLKESFPQFCRRVVFLTGGSFTEKANAFLSLKEIRHLEKPISRQDLLQVLDDVMGGQTTDGPAIYKPA